MNIKGQVEPLVGIIFIIGLVIIGGISSFNVLSEHRYIGDNSTKEYYDLATCMVNIQDTNLIKFENKQEAIREGFKSASCNR